MTSIQKSSKKIYSLLSFISIKNFCFLPTGESLYDVIFALNSYFKKSSKVKTSQQL